MWKNQNVPGLDLNSRTLQNFAIWLGPWWQTNLYRIPFLAHPDFARTTKRWLKRYIRPRKYNAIPFHLPKGTVREAAHSKVADILYNPFSWEEHDLSQPDQLPCPCKELLKTHPGLDNIDGHICGTLDQIRVATELYNCFPIWTVTLRCFPPSRTSLKPQQVHFRSGWRNMVIPVMTLPEFSSFLQEQWSLHLQSLATSTSTDSWSYFPVESDSWRTGSHPSCWSSKPEC